jgi:hypothetical protein
MTFRQLIIGIIGLVSASLVTGQTAGQLTLHLQCRNDTTEQYAIYLPSQYSESDSWPIIFVFDPVARAELAAETFRESAESLGYIVMVSHSARNGPWEPLLKAAGAMFSEAYAHYRIDTNRIYMTGFSGGSRAALLLALQDTRIDGVIGCGAGMPVGIEPPQSLSEYDFTYVGCVGTQDMNYHEQVAHQQSLDQAGIRNTLLKFRGPHQWPPPEVIREAMLYLDFQASQQGIHTQSTSIQAYRVALNRARGFHQQAYHVDAVDILSKITADFEGIVDISEALELMDSIEATKDFDKQVKYTERISRKETQLQSQMDAHLLQVTQLGLPAESNDVLKGVDWWISTLLGVRKSADKSDPLIQDMYMRIYRSSILTFIVGSENFAEYNLELALRFNQVWADSDPESLWAQYQMAKLLVESDNPEQALIYLERALELNTGFIDEGRLDQDFKALQDHPKFQKLKDKITP